MSDLTVWLRHEGFGPELNVVEGLEKTISEIFQQNPVAVQAEVTAITEVGSLVQSVITGAIDTKFPGATAISTALVTPLIQAIERTVESVVGAAGTTQAPPV